LPPQEKDATWLILLQKYFCDSICAEMTHVLKKNAGDVEDYEKKKYFFQLKFFDRCLLTFNFCLLHSLMRLFL